MSDVWEKLELLREKIREVKAEREGAKEKIAALERENQGLRRKLSLAEERIREIIKMIDRELGNG